MKGERQGDIMKSEAKSAFFLSLYKRKRATLSQGTQGR